MTRFHKIFYGSVIALLLSSCKHSSNSSLQSETSASVWKLGDTIRTPNHLTYAFSWTNETDYTVDPITTLESKLVGARNRNANGNSVDYRSAKAGAGIYGAADPFVSKSFGKYLLLLPFAPGQSLTALGGSLDDRQYRDIVKSNAAAVVYPWEAWMADTTGRSSGYAVVVRDSGILDLTRLKVIGPVESDFSCKELRRAPEVGEDWSTALSQISRDFFNCTLPVIHEHAEYFYSDHAQVTYASRRADMPLLFAAGIRSGAYLVEMAGVKADAVKCGTTPYCSLLFARSISRDIRSSWQGWQEDQSESDPSLNLAEQIRVAKEYQLLAADQQPQSVSDLHAALTKKLQTLQPDYVAIIDSHVTFYNRVMTALKDESMLHWQ